MRWSTFHTREMAPHFFFDLSKFNGGLVLGLGKIWRPHAERIISQLL